MHKPTLTALGLGALLSVLFAGSYLYACLATGVGPWAGPVVALAVKLAYLFIAGRRTVPTSELLTSHIMGEVGATVALAFTFGIPTLYFALPDDFEIFIARTGEFYLFFVLFIIFSAFMGLALARVLYPHFSENSSAEFPISRAVIDALEVSASWQSLTMVGGGFIGALCVSWFRDSAAFLWGGVLAGSVSIACGYVLAPMGWATGFFARLKSTVAIMAGVLFRCVVMAPILESLTGTSAASFRYGIATGLIFGPLFFSLFSFVRTFTLAHVRTVRSRFLRQCMQGRHLLLQGVKEFGVLGFFAAFVMGGMLWQSGIPVHLVLLLFLVSVPFIYHLALLAVQVGLCPFGRYMTMVMIFFMVVSALSKLQLTYIALFVGIMGLVAVDALFMFRVGSLAGVKLWRQLSTTYAIAIVVSALATVLFFVALYQQCGLGDGALLSAHRGSLRALILQDFSWELPPLLIGASCGIMSSLAGLHPALVLGGVMMPPHLAFAMLVGGIVHHVTKGSITIERIATGLLTGDAVWVLGGALACLW